MRGMNNNKIDVMNFNINMAKNDSYRILQQEVIGVINFLLDKIDITVGFLVIIFFDKNPVSKRQHDRNNQCQKYHCKTSWRFSRISPPVLVTSKINNQYNGLLVYISPLTNKLWKSQRRFIFVTQEQKQDH